MEKSNSCSKPPTSVYIYIYIQMIPLNTLDKFDCDSLSYHPRSIIHSVGIVCEPNASALPNPRSLFWDDQLQLEYPMLKQSLETRHQLHSKASQKCRKNKHELQLKYWYTKAVILWIFLSTVQKPIGSG